MPLCAIEASGNTERKSGCTIAQTTGFSFVMAGLDPAIHVFLRSMRKEDVDARHKAGHDGCIIFLGRPLPADRNLSFV